MKGTSRRGILGVLAAYGATLSVTKASAAAEKLDLASVKRESDIACLYHCDFGDAQRFSQLLTNVNNHLSVYDFDPFKIKIVLVAHGPGIKFFLHDLTETPWERERVDPELYQRFTGLTKYSVEDYLCEISFKRLKIDLSKTREDAFLRLVPSGVAAVAELQARGFSYLKVG